MGLNSSSREHPSQKSELSALENGSTDLAENLNTHSQGPLINRPRLLSFNAKSGSRISHPMIHSLILIYNFRQLEVFKKIYFKKFFHQWKFSGT